VDLNGSKVVVTGASRGIGEHIAEGFATRGATVLGVARSADRLEALAKRIRGHSIVADLGTAEGVDGLVERCVAELGHIDVWVNNAGIETDSAFIDVERDNVRLLARLNFEAPLMLTRDVLTHMAERGSGHIVQMSSVAGVIPFPGLAAYAGSKAGLINFTETLRWELRSTNIGLTVVAPGPVATEMWDRLDSGEGYTAAPLERFRRLMFLPKVKPEKVATRTVDAVARGRRYVRLPVRYGVYHLLNNAPRRMVEFALIGVKAKPKSA